MSEMSEKSTDFISCDPPVIVTSMCVGCGSCESVCPAEPNVFVIEASTPMVVNPSACTGCNICVIICPVYAVLRDGESDKP